MNGMRPFEPATMRLCVSASLLTLALTSTTLAGQVSQGAPPSSEPGTRTQGSGSTTGSQGSGSTIGSQGSGSTTGSSSSSTTGTTGTSSTPERPATSGAPPVTAPALQQATPIGRPNGEVAPQSAAPGAPSPCAGRPSTGATASATPSSATASPFPGVSSSQLPRAGVSSDAFVRPGVSAAQLSTLLPGARSSPCGPPRDFIPYPDTGTPTRRAPPPSVDGP